jgi:hypothetical protein
MNDRAHAGDVSPQSDMERGYAIVAMCIGGGYFGAYN